MSSKSLSVSFKAKRKSKKNRKAEQFVQVFLKWHKHVQEWRSLRWGLKYAEEHDRVREGSPAEVQFAAEVCGGDYREATLLGFAKDYQTKFHCKGCANLNDSKYKVYCATCTDKWKAAAEAKAEASIRSFCAVKFGSLVDESSSEEEEEQSDYLHLSPSGSLERTKTSRFSAPNVHKNTQLSSCP